MTQNNQPNNRNENDGEDRRAEKNTQASSRPNQNGSSYGRPTGEKAAPHRSNGRGRSSARKGTPMKIIPLGGLDGIGKNMTALVYGNDMIVIDAGLMFPDDDHPGVDLILPDYTFVLENVEKLRAILVTHGHKTIPAHCPI